MDNKEKFKKIRMEDVYKAIEENGFYTTPTEKHYDENFIGSELIVVTDDPDFKVKYPELAEMIIVSSQQFKPMADIYNESMWNDRREMWRDMYWHNTEGYYEDSPEDENGNCHALKIKDLPLNPVVDEVEKREIRQMVRKAMTGLSEKQFKRVYYYYFKGMTYRQIAAMESADDKTIRESIDGALKKIKKYFENTPSKRLSHCL